VSGHAPVPAGRVTPACLDVDGVQGRALSDAIDARRDEIVDAAEAAGVPAAHCGGRACFVGGRWLCECACSGCTRFLDLQVLAEVELRRGAGPRRRARGAR
jgi:hypothetical protein